MNPFAKPFVPSFAAKQEMSADEIFCDPKVQYYSTLQMLFEEEGSSDEMNEYYSEEKSESFSSDSNADAVVTEKENFSIKSISQIAPQHRKSSNF